MNEKRRGQLRNALTMMTNAASIIDAVCDKEQDCLDNFPENLQKDLSVWKMPWIV